MKKTYSKNGIIALCSLVYFVSYFSRKDFAAAMVGMLSSSVIDKTAAGLMGMLMFIFYGGGQLISGYLGDKFKPQHVIVAGLSMTAVCNALMPFVSSGVMIAVWGVNGLAQAMMWPPIVKILSEHLDKESYVRASLIVTSAAHIATILLYLFVPLCLVIWSWETVFFVVSVLVLISTVIFILALRYVLPKEAVVRRIEENAPSNSLKPGSLKLSKALAESGIIPILGSIIACGFLRDGIESWLPTLYSEAFGRDASESVLLSVVLPIFSIVSISVVTALHKNALLNNEVRGSATIFVISIVLCLPLALLINVETVAARIICLVLAALVCALMHGINFLLISCLPGRFASLGRSSSVGGLVNAFIYIGAAASMYGIAVVSENLGWCVTVALWAAVAAVGALLAAFAHRKYTHFISYI